MEHTTTEPVAPATDAVSKPRGRWFAGVAGVAGALTLGALGAGLGGWLGWSAADDLPEDKYTLVIAQPLVPGTRLHAPDGRHEPAFGYDPAYTGAAGVQALLFGGDDYNGGYVYYRIDPPGHNVTGAIDVARKVLDEDRSMTVSTRDPDLPGQADGITAVGRDLVLQVYQDGPDRLIVEIGRRAPSPVGPLVAVGALAGLALGWFGMRRAVAGTRVTAVTAWVGVGLLAPCTLLTYPIVAGMYAAPETQPVASWDIYTATGFRLLANLGVLALLVATVATVLVQRRRRLPW